MFQKTKLIAVMAAFVLMATAFSAVPVMALETTGVPGSPSATTTISGKQLPAPAPPFGGVIKDDALNSKQWWPPRVVPPKGAPNILLIMTDDAGFAVPSTFGGVIPTPTMDRIAQKRSALQPHILDLAVLADARRLDHRTQPPLGRFRRDLRTGDRFSRATTASSAWTMPPSAASCWTTATPPRGSAKTTTPRPSRPARSDRSISGPPAWASSTSTGSWEATPTSGSRISSATPPRSTPSKGTRAP